MKWWWGNRESKIAAESVSKFTSSRQQWQAEAESCAGEECNTTAEASRQSNIHKYGGKNRKGKKERPQINNQQTKRWANSLNKIYRLCI